jgi:Transposase IS66 family
LPSFRRTLQRRNMMAADYRHIGGRENRLGRHYSRFSAFWPAPALAGQSLALRKLCDAGSNRRSRANRHLASYAGILQADAYAGFGDLYDARRRPGPITEAACWSHGRRKFFVLADLGKSPLAVEAVRRIDAIFAIEREINGIAAEQRLALRQERIRPLVGELEGWMRAERARLSRHADIAKAIDYMLKRWPAFTRFLDDGRICLSNSAAERALRGIAMRRSLCPSSSSTWKHWKLVCRHDATRTTCLLNRGSHPFLLQIIGTDLAGSARHNLLGGENAVLDEPADAVVCNPEPRSGLRHREPFAILLGGTVGMDSIHPAHRADTVRSPGFSLTGGHSHPVQGRGDVRVRPSGRHGPHHRKGLIGGAAAMLARPRLADPQL